MHVFVPVTLTLSVLTIVFMVIVLPEAPGPDRKAVHAVFKVLPEAVLPVDDPLQVSSK